MEEYSACVPVVKGTWWLWSDTQCNRGRVRMLLISNGPMLLRHVYWCLLWLGVNLASITCKDQLRRNGPCVLNIPRGCWPSIHLFFSVKLLWANLSWRSGEVSINCSVPLFICHLYSPGFFMPHLFIFWYFSWIFYPNISHSCLGFFVGGKMDPIRSVNLLRGKLFTDPEILMFQVTLSTMYLMHKSVFTSEYMCEV